jgi:hypothetical protein
VSSERRLSKSDMSPNDYLGIHLRSAFPSLTPKPEAKLVPTACSASQIVPEHPQSGTVCSTLRDRHA